MKHVKANFHSLHVLKHARPKLRKAILSNCDKEPVNCISECVLNILNGNIALTGCEKCKLKLKICVNLSIDKYRYRARNGLSFKVEGSSSHPACSPAHTC